MDSVLIINVCTFLRVYVQCQSGFCWSKFWSAKCPMNDYFQFCKSHISKLNVTFLRANLFLFQLPQRVSGLSLSVLACLLPHNNILACVTGAILIREVEQSLIAFSFP